jgi:hypothetical protein
MHYKKKTWQHCLDITMTGTPYSRATSNGCNWLQTDVHPELNMREQLTLPLAAKL